MVTIEQLEAFFDRGWNGHDVDVLMTFMSDDCVFEAAAGRDACGTRHAGRARVREAFARVFASFPDVRFDDARHFVATTKEKFDAITSDPLDQWVKGAAMLYTREFFQLAKEHLNPGGAMTLSICRRMSGGTEPRISHIS